MSESESRKLRSEFSRTASRVDPIEGILIREERVREKLINIEMTKIIAKKLKDCYRREGVNHYVKCEKYARAYYARVAHPEFAGEPDFKTGPVEMNDIQ